MQRTAFNRESGWATPWFANVVAFPVGRQQFMLAGRTEPGWPLSSTLDTSLHYHSVKMLSSHDPADSHDQTRRIPLGRLGLCLEKLVPERVAGGGRMTAQVGLPAVRPGSWISAAACPAPHATAVTGLICPEARRLRFLPPPAPFVQFDHTEIRTNAI